MIQTKTLSNGVRVIVKRMEGLLSVTMGILVGTGSAFERDEEDGISHFLEHMQFKGTPTRTAFEISDAFDDIGADVNAYTSKDVTCYYSKATTDHAAEAFHLLADLFLNADFPEKEMEREKGVVLQEIKKAEDSYDDLCLDLLAQAAFGRENYGRNILGPAANVKRFTREDLFGYKHARYTPSNIVISFAGNVEISEAMDLAEECFGSMAALPLEARPLTVGWKKQTLFIKKPSEQVHLAIGFRSKPRKHDSIPAIQVMNSILGGSLSSRLFKRVREELGLAYEVYSYDVHYAETGVLAIYAGVEPEAREGAVAAIAETVRTLQREGVSGAEFKRGREQLKAGSIFSQENTSSQMLLYGKNLLYFNEVYDFEKRMEEISSLTEDDLARVIAESFDFSEAVTAAVGDLDGAVLL